MKSKKKKKTFFIVGIVFLLILIIALLYDIFINKKDKTSYFNEIKYNNVIEKLDNKENFILCITQTTCSHCDSFKPKIKKVANQYKVYVYYLEVDLLKDKELSKLREYFTYDSTPTTIFFKNGEEKTVATRLVGDADSEKIINKMKSNGFISE